jgi:peptide chain release factor subunit 3
MELSEPVVGNGETEMSPEESWKHKEEISEAKPGGWFLRKWKATRGKHPRHDGGGRRNTKPKSVVAPTAAPTEEHVNSSCMLMQARQPLEDK